MTPSVEVVALYRAILKAAARFPSRKRSAIIEDIKAEFRDGSRATEVAEVRQRLALAKDGLARLRSFSGLSKMSSDWQVSLAGPAVAGTNDKP